MADDIAQWLEGLGLGQYAPAFAENDVDIKNLVLLSDDDLKELGLSLGHRRTLLAALKGDPTGQPSGEPAEKTTDPAASAPEAERRQLTVMFCDLVGSTALSSQLDPEDMRDVIRSYQDACAGIVARYGGYVAKYMGDGVLAYFGYPRAHEDDAERAIHAGLGVVAAVGELDRPDDAPGPFGVRVGIATGTVVVGDLIGEGSAQEAAITGETPNLAARLQEIAQPDTVVIAETTHRLAGKLFDSDDLGPQSLKGIADATRIWTVNRPHRAESRFDVAHTGGLTDLVGRDDEIDALLRRWRRAKAGEGQLVLISGEPGIGKSRMARALQERIADDPHVPVRLQCSPFHTSSALRPFIEQLERVLDFSANDAPPSKLDKLEAWIELVGPATTEDAPLMAALLSIPTNDRYRALDATPQRQKELTLRYLTDRLTVQAAERPMLFIVEDAHWIDPTSLELLDRMVERIQDAAALMLITHRPEFEAPWLGRPRVTPLFLGRLDQRDCALMVWNVVGRASLSEELRDRIVEQTDGVPLFVEELTKSVLESARSGPQESVEITIPATLMDSLEARLDGLGPAKEIAQIGAVIGREFTYDLVATVAPTEVNLDDALDRLAGAELVLRRGQPPDATYTFKHALIQDTAYGSLLRGRRAELHERVARSLEEKLAQVVSQRPEVLAHHFTEAGLKEEGTRYWLKAGQLAFEQSAIKEAQTHFEKGLAVIAELPDEPSRHELEINLNVALASAIRTAQGPGHTEEVYLRAYHLCQKADNSPQLFAVLYGLCMAHFIGGNLDRARLEAEELIALAERNVEQLVIANMLLGEIHWWAGNNDEALQHFEKGEGVYDPQKHSAFAATYARDPETMWKVHESLARLSMGFPNQALATIGEAVSRAVSVKHPHAIWTSRSIHLYHQLELGNARAASEEANEIFAFVREMGFGQMASFSNAFRILALSRSGIGSGDLSVVEEEISTFVESGYVTFEVWFELLLASEYLNIEGAEKALELTEHALQRISETGLRQFESIALFTKGDALWARDLSDALHAEQCYLQAIDIARLQSAKMWELRAATRLGRLWRSQGKSTEARDLLAPVYDWFTEGFDTADLKEAKTLLDELS